MSPTSVVFTTLPSRRSIDSSSGPPSQFGSLLSNPQARGYSGAAELA
jgi:hypothetical protein